MKINTFKAFRSRNFSLYFTGQTISFTGTWMQRTAVYWLIYSQTHSSFMLGLAVFASQFPSFLFSPLGGVIADRYNQYKVVIFTQFSAMIQAVLLTILVLFTKYTVWEIFALSVVLGIINAFDLPARQSLIHKIVADKEDLQNAIALNSSIGKLAWLVGPAISGIILEKHGAGISFLLNAVSYIAVIASLFMMKLAPYVSHQNSKKVMKEFKEGFVYIKQTPNIGLIILLLAFVSLIALPFNTLLPVYAKVIFQGNASTYGYLNSSIGMGALIGAVYLASLKNAKNLKNLLMINLFVFGISLAIFSYITNLHIAFIFALIAGFAMMSQTTIGNTIIQTDSSPEMRGRVLSFFMMAFFGLQPIGGLFIGSISHYIGVQNTLLGEGIAALLIAVLFVYIFRKKIIKEETEKKSLEFESDLLTQNN